MFADRPAQDTPRKTPCSREPPCSRILNARIALNMRTLIDGCLETLARLPGLTASTYEHVNVAPAAPFAPTLHWRPTRQAKPPNFARNAAKIVAVT